MAEGVRRRVWLYPTAFVAIAAFLVMLRLLPLGLRAGAWPGPDLLLCLILAWVIRRPDYLPAPLLAVVLLLEDLLLMRPPGLWAALVLVATEFLRSRAALTRELSFPVEWLLVSGVMLALRFGERTIAALALLPQPALGEHLLQTAMTILCYPLIVGCCWLLLDLRKPATGELDAFGRRM
ncbi:rod shape-determining protein MreD [Cereibacter johrii]|uniref:Rod shape-determining protein MreD n=1 Tax=Cereibacter johrii TaxID=445629 RepID=A0ABX5JCY9_9RHOB|nr:rod shape-determining protein MreD [Cereibacter johrii]QCP86006.1 rod shape-determining protein MreD [Cereibacter sphaeroides]RDS96221.1 rod shape-determining protein MreD [Cereibacter sphaeroides f. sp. denitrificans]ODM42350.1 rod shape-determining protein MreD [Cereibacter johrii]PTM81707.1 rod shape-determining protein MreD [Cereibacter johrii]RAZ87806.1 rod shape-determining protein MreD [Cereibacter johrii]